MRLPLAPERRQLPNLATVVIQAPTELASVEPMILHYRRALSPISQFPLLVRCPPQAGSEPTIEIDQKRISIRSAVVQNHRTAETSSAGAYGKSPVFADRSLSNK